MPMAEHAPTTLRRGLLAAAAALPFTALPAVSGVAPDDDPALRLHARIMAAERQAVALCDQVAAFNARPGARSRADVLALLRLLEAEVAANAHIADMTRTLADTPAVSAAGAAAKLRLGIDLLTAAPGDGYAAGEMLALARDAVRFLNNGGEG